MKLGGDYLTVFDHAVRLALKGLRFATNLDYYYIIMTHQELPPWFHPYMPMLPMSHHKETNQLINKVTQLTGSFMRGTSAVNMFSH